MGSWKGRGNQYIQFIRDLYCKLPTNGKELPAFPLEAVPGTKPPASEVGGQSVTTVPPQYFTIKRAIMLKIFIDTRIVSSQEVEEK